MNSASAVAPRWTGARLKRVGGGSRVPFLLWCYVVTGLVLSAFVVRGGPGSPRSWLFGAAAVLSYSLIYILPVWFVTRATGWSKRYGIAIRVPADALMILVASGCQMLLASDYLIQGMWFICESLRADMLTPEIMPRTWEFAASCQRFTNHHSGGNGTRMGVFTAFYGLPGSYWFRFLGQRRPPVLMDRVQELGYRLHFSTSAAFSYPEFDKTIFAHVPAADLYAYHEGSGWESDRHNVARMKTWLAQDDGTRPFFLFHFFESPHARYYFPPESVIRCPYLEEFNYATVNVAKDIDLIRNRYINAVHHLDSQLGEMIDALRAKGVLDNTFVLITGDHGEEFMETGRWGHNSEFTEPQLRVPLVLHVPGRDAGVFGHPTSHVDFVPTLLPLLGVGGPSGDYSTGEDLFSTGPRLLTFADWDRIAISDGVTKAVFPLKAGAQWNARVTSASDRPVDESAALKQLGGPMVRLKDMMSRFTRKR